MPSQLRRILQVLFALILIGVLVICLYPVPERESVSHIDKVAHSLTWWFITIWGVVAFSVPRRFFVAAGCFLYSVAIEFIQPLAGRSFEGMDMLANASGILLALGMLTIVHRPWESKSTS